MSQTAWNALNDLAKQRVVAQQSLRAINELEDVTQAELVALLNRAADELEPETPDGTP